MQRRFSWLQFGVVLAIVSGYVLLTGRSLPDVVASHFGGSGVANEFLPRTSYLALILFAAVGVPLFIAGVTRLDIRGSMNVPNREYWLTPERYPETIGYLRGHFISLGALIALFLCFMHWLTLEANRRQPPQLALEWFFAGFAALLVVVVLWTVALYRRFALPK